MSFPGEPISGKVYTVVGQLQNDLSVESEAYIRFEKGAPVLTRFDMYYSAHSIRKLDLLHSEGATLTNPIYPGQPFKFVVNFDNYQCLGIVRIVSTKSGVVHMMNAEATETPGEYIAEGYFEGTDKNYIPGNLNVYYTTYVSKEEATRLPTLEELPESWQNSVQTVITDTEDTYLSELQFENNEKVTIERRIMTVEELRAELLGNNNRYGDETVTLSSIPRPADPQDSDSIFFDFLKDFAKTYTKNYWSNGVDTLVTEDPDQHKYTYFLYQPALKTVKTLAIKYSAGWILSDVTQKASWSTPASCVKVVGLAYSEYNNLVNFTIFSLIWTRQEMRSGLTAP